ncbi:MAG: YigZ family protein [Epsilonproteobacteria bacterium]|nr:YigZ family protein [Campylobacterota bacterium]
MKTIYNSFSSSVQVNKSKFITHLVLYTEFENTRKELKKLHPKANHIVYAYRYLNDLDQIVEASSDDGEPKGCAGVPALNVLRGEELVNVAVLIVRYFGGIKLGTGGMARAYAKSVKDVINISDLKVYEKEVKYSFSSPYSDVDKIDYNLKKIGIIDIQKDFVMDRVNWIIKANQEKIDLFCDKLSL